jgi:hypothetical protein
MAMLLTMLFLTTCSFADPGGLMIGRCSQIECLLPSSSKGRSCNHQSKGNGLKPLPRFDDHMVLRFRAHGSD